MNLDHIYEPVTKELKAVEKRLSEFAPPRDSLAGKTVSGLLEAGGKRLRPALLLLAARACGYIGERSINLAVAVELIHTASLIHDDIIDGADLRRGKPTINANWGNKISVLAGDHVYAKVFGILTNDGHLDAMKVVVDTACHMTESEMVQTLCRQRMDVTEEEYLSIIEGKTASLISCACRIGAMLGEMRDGEVNVLRGYGSNLGMVFQITDDLLDIVGDANRLGKPLGNDIREGRLTLPFIHALGKACEEDKKLMTDVFGLDKDLDESSLSSIREMLDKYGAIEYGLETANKYGKACKEQLNLLTESDSRKALTMLVDHMIERAT